MVRVQCWPGARSCPLQVSAVVGNAAVSPVMVIVVASAAAVPSLDSVNVSVALSPAGTFP